MSTSCIQFKIKQPGIAWISTPVVLELSDKTEPPIAIHALANAIALHVAEKFGAEVRWNFTHNEHGYFVWVTKYCTLPKEV